MKAPFAATPTFFFWLKLNCLLLASGLKTQSLVLLTLGHKSVKDTSKTARTQLEQSKHTTADMDIRLRKQSKNTTADADIRLRTQLEWSKNTAAATMAVVL